jgi:hypothetical protein
MLETLGSWKKLACSFLVGICYGRDRTLVAGRLRQQAAADEETGGNGRKWGENVVSWDMMVMKGLK